MKKNRKTIIAIALLGLIISCKQVEAEVESASENGNTDQVHVQEESEAISSTAAVEPKNTNRKFVRTADIRFKVKNVAESTGKIEETVSKFGGFVTHTELESHISEVEKTQVSQDSLLETTKYTVDNSITIRVPNTQLDTVIKIIAKENSFLNHRKITADDVTLQILSNKMAQKRSNSTEKRIEKAIDEKGKKLNQIIESEDVLANKKELNDAKLLQNLELEDRIGFSTLTLDIYQDQTIKHELIACEKNINAFRPNIGWQIWDSIKTGWFILEKIISFIVVLWPFALMGFLGWFGYKKLVKKVSFGK